MKKLFLASIIMLLLTPMMISSCVVKPQNLDTYVYGSVVDYYGNPLQNITITINRGKHPGGFMGGTQYEYYEEITTDNDGRFTYIILTEDTEYNYKICCELLQGYNWENDDDDETGGCRDVNMNVRDSKSITNYMDFVMRKK